MWQNLAWATGYNIITVPVAAGALAFAGISVSPAVAAILMSVSTVVVALNAQLLRRLNLDPDRLSTVDLGCAGAGWDGAERRVHPI